MSECCVRAHGETAVEGVDRRSFMAYFSAVGLAGTLLPGVLWAKVQEASTLSKEVLAEAEKVAGLDFTDAEREMMLQGLERNLRAYEALREIPVPNEVPPAVTFDPMLPGRPYPTEVRPFRMSRERGVERPARLEEVAFWPVTKLSELVRTGQVSSVELTEMYLERLEVHGPTLEAVISRTDDLALAQAR
jgi:hypothetical protein